MPEQVVLFLMSLPAPTVALRRFFAGETVGTMWKLVWALGMLGAGGLSWWVSLRVLFALFNPGLTGGRVLFALAVALAACAAVGMGYVLAPFLLVPVA